MNNINSKIYIEIYPQLRHISFCKLFLKKTLSLSDTHKNRILLCIDEMLVNIIQHTRNIRNKDIIKISLANKMDKIIIIIEHTGEKYKFTPGEIDVFKKRYSGGGLHLVTNLSNSVSYKYENNINKIIIEQLI